MGVDDLPGDLEAEHLQLHRHRRAGIVVGATQLVLKVPDLPGEDRLEGDPVVEPVRRQPPGGGGGRLGPLKIADRNVLPPLPIPPLNLASVSFLKAAEYKL